MTPVEPQSRFRKLLPWMPFLAILAIAAVWFYWVPTFILALFLWPVALLGLMMATAAEHFEIISDITIYNYPLFFWGTAIVCWPFTKCCAKFQAGIE